MRKRKGGRVGSEGGKAGGREGAGDPQTNRQTRTGKGVEYYIEYMQFYFIHKKSHQGFLVENSFEFVF